MVARPPSWSQGSGPLPPVVHTGAGPTVRGSTNRLRVGKVISEARSAVQTDNAWERRPSLPAPSHIGRLIDDGEQRMQQELIDMLTAKLAKKEKEVEQYRLQHDALEREKLVHQSVVDQLTNQVEQTREEMSSQVSSLAITIQQKEADLRDAYHAVDQIRREATGQTHALQEAQQSSQRYAERLRVTETDLQRQLADARRQAAAALAEKQSLEGRMVGMQQQHRMLSATVAEYDHKFTLMEAEIAQYRARLGDLEQEVERSRANEARQCHQHKALEEEKKALEDRIAQLTQTLRGVNTRATEAERRKSSLAQSESQLTKQLTQLHRENEELKARTGQLLTQTKQQQARIIQLEANKSAVESKFTDASDEIAQAKKRCSEYQFRIRQLQEEVVFLTKKKPQKQGELPPRADVSVNEERSSVAPTDLVVPSWMRD